MSIILLHSTEDKGYALALVYAALLRSFSAAQVACFSYDHFNYYLKNTRYIYCLLNPGEPQRNLVKQLASHGQKLLLLGRLGANLASDIGVLVNSIGAPPKLWDEVYSSTECDVSNVVIEYECDHPLTTQLGFQNRALRRYDFTDEWNTLGFGRITVDGSPWSLCQLAQSTQANVLASVIDAHGKELAAYAAISDTPTSSILWFNRAVGPIDSLEWTIIENFCSHYRADELVCIPYVMEIPAGYDGASTMRLDCDQDIASSRPLFELYQDLGVPLSLAVVTGLPPQDCDIAFLREVLAHGGAVVSHSCTHPPNWGVDYTAAFQEARDSKAWLEQHLPEAGPIHYAVSPFHQNPPYAVQALADAQYLGFVGGIIHNDPEYLLGRSGQVPLCDQPLISHSQQCMLHGDCYHRYGNSVAPYCESFTHHFKAGALFGYLDHPFSAAYQYGWDTEEERLFAHENFLRFIKSHNNIWYPNLVECLEFVRKRQLVIVSLDATEKSLAIDWKSTTVPLTRTPAIQIGWKGETVTIHNSKSS